MALQSFQQLTGANYFFYYGATIFTSVGISDSFITQIILGAVNFICTFGGLYVMERVSIPSSSSAVTDSVNSLDDAGHSSSVVYGVVSGSSCSALLALQKTLRKTRVSDKVRAFPSSLCQTELTSVIVMIISACMFILGYATTWAPGVWIIIGETFPMRTRAKQGAISTASNWLWNFLLAFFTPFIVRAIQFRYGFVFAGTPFPPSFPRHTLTCLSM